MKIVQIKKRVTIPREFMQGVAESKETITVRRGTILVDVKPELYEVMQKREDVFECSSLAN